MNRHLRIASILAIILLFAGAPAMAQHGGYSHHGGGHGGGFWAPFAFLFLIMPMCQQTWRKPLQDKALHA